MISDRVPHHEDPQAEDDHHHVDEGYVHMFMVLWLSAIVFVVFAVVTDCSNPRRTVLLKS